MKIYFLLALTLLFFGGCEAENKNQELNKNTKWEILDNRAGEKGARETNAITFYLVSPLEDDMSDLEKYLTPITKKISKKKLTTAGRVWHALDFLFREDSGNSERGPWNPLSLSDITVKVKDEDGALVVDIQGEIIGTGVLSDAFVKPQIEKTIEEYTENYQITLNGSEKKWKCLLDMRDKCSDL